MKKIGISGNIASGKSTVENIIASSGYKVVDLDIVSHKLLDTVCKDEVLTAFNTTDRKKLAGIVFKDKTELKKLEDIIYPKLKRYVLGYFEQHEKEEMVFISGALIFEAGFSELFDKIIFVDCDKETRLERLMKRNSMDIKSAKIRIEAQNDNYKNYADFIIENNSDIECLKEKVFEVLKQL